MVDRISPLRFLIILFLVVSSVLNGQKKKHICYDGIELSRLLDSLSAQYEVFFLTRLLQFRPTQWFPFVVTTIMLMKC